MIIDFDKYSLIIDNKRLQVRSASLHYFRIPDIKAWKDRLSKIKAAGYNTVDLYFCWGYHSKHPGFYDFTDIKDVRALLDIAVELELFVIARPGPYINAELSAGGLPFWLFNLPDILIRNRKNGKFKYSLSYMQAVKEWYSRIIPIINEYHNIIAFQIENEYATDEAEPDYLQELHDIARDIGVKAPIFHNDMFCAGLYSDIANIYAFDAYPTINLDYHWRDFPDGFGILDNIEENMRIYSPDSPLFIAEFQAGWFDKWGGHGYDHIRKQFGRNHINIATKTALSQGVTMFNHYMGCGGTSWNNLACDEVYTSYDFAALISESGIPQENYYKAKEINCFLQAFNLSSTDLISDETELLDKKEENIFAKLRQDNLNNCQWLFIRNLNKFRKNLEIQGFDVSINSFDMKILPVGLNLYGCVLDFSSLSIFGRIQNDDHEVILLIMDENAEIIVSGYQNKEISEAIQSKEEDNKLKIRIFCIPDEDLISFKFSGRGKTTEFIFLKEETADKTWIANGKLITGPDFLTDNGAKAAFTDEREFKILDLSKNTGWKTSKIENIPKIKPVYFENYGCFTCSPEIDYGYDYSNWNFVKDENKLDCISNSVYDEFIWYKGSFTGPLDQICLSAKHCYDIYLNGTRIFGHDSFYPDEKELITLNIDHKMLKRDKNNELTVLTQNLGFDKGYEHEPNLPRGILSLKMTPLKDIEWKIRGNLTPALEEWDFISIDNLENASKNSYFVWLYTTFNFDPPENAYAPLFLNFDNPFFDKANIYLNGNLIGHYWKSKGPQVKFYLPEGFLKSKNRLSLVIWNRDKDYQKIEDFKSFQKNVNITVKIINPCGIVNLKELGV